MGSTKFVSGFLFRGPFFLSLMFLVACAGPAPLREYALANEARYYAKKHYASKYAPKYFYKGNKAFKAALAMYEKRENEKAMEYFNLSRKIFEKAELKARLKQLEAGEDFL